MSDAEGKAVTIRTPSTANLMLDSYDKTTGDSSNFLIQRNQSILNGFFTRIGTTEVVLEWNVPNGSLLSNQSLEITYGANPAITYTPDEKKFYTVASMLTEIVDVINTELGAVDVAVGSPPVITAPPNTAVGAGGVYLYSADFTTQLTITGTLATTLGLTPLAGENWLYLVDSPDLRSFRYLDFVSAQLTYNQELKDASTKAFVRDVLCRWYMAYDNPPSLDALGFPILMGYTPFVLRRLFNPPKQIKWSPQQVLGQIAFQVYTDLDFLVGQVVPGAKFNWLMTLQITEN